MRFACLDNFILVLEGVKIGRCYDEVIKTQKRPVFFIWLLAVYRLSGMIYAIRDVNLAWLDRECLGYKHVFLDGHYFEDVANVITFLKSSPIKMVKKEKEIALL